MDVLNRSLPYLLRQYYRPVGTPHSVNPIKNSHSSVPATFTDCSSLPAFFFQAVSKGTDESKGSADSATQQPRLPGTRRANEVLNSRLGRQEEGERRGAASRRTATHRHTTKREVGIGTCIRQWQGTSAGSGAEQPRENSRQVAREEASAGYGKGLSGAWGGRGVPLLLVALRKRLMHWPAQQKDERGCGTGALARRGAGQDRVAFCGVGKLRGVPGAGHEPSLRARSAPPVPSRRPAGRTHAADWRPPAQGLCVTGERSGRGDQGAAVEQSGRKGQAIENRTGLARG